MSRIYDALQRADLERQAAQGKDATENAEPYLASGSEDLAPIEAGVSLENTVLHTWKPSLVSLPTLGDRGEGIEQFRGLRSQIYQFRDQNPLKTILVSSGMPGEGKTFVVANLAVSLARNRNNTVLLIDADLRRPSLHAILGAPGTPGLTEYLAGTAEVSDIVQRNENPRVVEAGIMHAIPDLAFIPAGAGGDNASELVANHRIEELVAALSPHFDWILIDSPPVLAFSDAVDLARAADAVLLVARSATTPFNVAQRAQTAFSNSRILGFVLNAVRNAPRRTSYYYDYGQQDASSGSPKGKDKRRPG
ncbi:MAG TPA: CpsD/CapB family tyrosine-protein kinase [Terracidiphilus sp.]|jgi:capsular exopolysaccharide synthesis family protein|nr:CpsD/CapB family tyrosine-protein kinase [Terracidiphilus sp.]